MTEQKTDTVNAEPTCLREYLTGLTDAQLASRRFLLVMQQEDCWEIESLGEDIALIDMARAANDFAIDVAAVGKPEGRAH